MIATLILPLLLQSAEPVAAVEDPNDAEARRIAALSASLRADVARCYSDYPREAACFSEANDKAVSAVELEADKLAANLLAADAAELADCDKEQAETAVGCSRDLLATHKAAHSLWRAYADQQCTLDGLPSRGGWGQGAEYNACYIRLSADRIDVMWARVRFYGFVAGEL
jgi:Lysozyme inhibitor LprI